MERGRKETRARVADEYKGLQRWSTPGGFIDGNSKALKYNFLTTPSIMGKLKF